MSAERVASDETHLYSRIAVDAINLRSYEFISPSLRGSVKEVELSAMLGSGRPKGRPRETPIKPLV